MKNGHQSRHEKSLLGFTLLELMVVIVLIGILVAIAIPTLRSLTSADLRNEITKIAGLANEVYALAAISGKTHRIVFDLDNQKFWVEEKVGDAGDAQPELGYEELMKAAVEKQSKDKEENPGSRFLPSFKEVEGTWGEKVDLAKDVVFHGAWTEQMSDIARTGQVSLYFFSGGYTQTAFISLALKGEETESSMYLSLSPLTGEVETGLGEPDINQLLASGK